LRNFPFVSVDQVGSKDSDSRRPSLARARYSVR